MTMLHTTTADAFTPEDYGALVDLAVKAKSVAARTATYVSTDRVKINFPLWLSDPAVGWYAENATISETDGSTDEVSCTPTKTAGITPISNELADDSTPAIADLVGRGLANQVTRALDAAYLGNTTTNGPSGLLSVAYSDVDTGASLANLDPFVEARFTAEQYGSQLTSWVVRPAIAQALSQLKIQTGSNQSLIQFVEDGIRIAGLPVVVSNQVDAATLFWGIPREHVNLVVRKGTKVEKFPNVYKDGQLLRVTARHGFAFTNPPGVVRGYNVTP
ncbi:phage major capsid protein [Mycobacteroides abscessus]|nr:phage major capsid protein [Mycobacteroides abscessus]MDM2230235.1 phage major capsid protein [Mycobacteroides abscessus]MDM2241822.1 phage major capsid protein [Mycobacteroides abscessus]MDM2250786.1 phage major capsid protein [Mycobacteroides abscessus]